MPFDPASIGPEARAKDIEIGEDFGSDDVLRQLDVSILGTNNYGTSLVLHGWPATQTQKLREVRALLQTALVQRDAAKAEKKTMKAALLDAVRAGKNARGAARTALTTARNELFEQSKLDLVNQIDGVLGVTAGSGADAKLLAQQLGNLGALLTHEEVAPILGDAAPQIQGLVSTAATALDVAITSKNRPHGTPPETEYINLLDGVAVVLLRTLRKAGRSAAKALGQPDIADAFQLRELYDAPPHRTADEPPPVGPAS